jgi:hypothetical protein
MSTRSEEEPESRRLARYADTFELDRNRSALATPNVMERLRSARRTLLSCGETTLAKQCDTLIKDIGRGRLTPKQVSAQMHSLIGSLAGTGEQFQKGEV